jgi:hypothetical protein
VKWDIQMAEKKAEKTVVQKAVCLVEWMADL